VISSSPDCFLGRAIDGLARARISPSRRHVYSSVQLCPFEAVVWPAAGAPVGWREIHRTKLPRRPRPRVTGNRAMNAGLSHRLKTGPRSLCALAVPDGARMAATYPSVRDAAPGHRDAQRSQLRLGHKPTPIPRSSPAFEGATSTVVQLLAQYQRLADAGSTITATPSLDKVVIGGQESSAPRSPPADAAPGG